MDGVMDDIFRKPGYEAGSEVVKPEPDIQKRKLEPMTANDEGLAFSQKGGTASVTGQNWTIITCWSASSIGKRHHPSKPEYDQ